MTSSDTELSSMVRLLALLGTVHRAIRDITQACHGRDHVKSVGTWFDIQNGWNKFAEAESTMFEGIAEITTHDDECFGWHLDIDVLGGRISAQAYVDRYEKYGPVGIIEFDEREVRNFDELEQALAGLCKDLAGSADRFDFASGKPASEDSGDPAS